MSYGNHFHSNFWTSRKGGIPKLGAQFLVKTHLPETDKSKDPLLVTKPVETDFNSFPKETENIIHTSLLQSGQGQSSNNPIVENQDIYSDSSSSSSIEDFELENPISETKSLLPLPEKRKLDNADLTKNKRQKTDSVVEKANQTPKKYKEFKFKITEWKTMESRQVESGVEAFQPSPQNFFDKG